jgi:hypothetical protein
MKWDTYAAIAVGNKLADTPRHRLFYLHILDMVPEPKHKTVAT